MPGEIYWLEITDRTDLGVDLNAPQKNDDGREYWGYALIREIDPGDVVFHYHKQSHAILAVSRAVGHVWDDEVLWGAHGTTARGAGVQPYPRAGWRLALENFTPLLGPVALSAVRERRAVVTEIRDKLADAHPGIPLFFPFELSERRAPRPTQAYLTKFPKDLLETIPELRPAVGAAAAVLPASGASLGGNYRHPDEEAAVSEREPFSVDPSKVERALRGHATTQNALAAHLRGLGINPRSPIAVEPSYDIAWELAGVVYVGEVKSLPPGQEESQLRIGLGQVLRYRQRLQLLRPRDRVLAVLIPERQPDPTWWALCSELGVLLAWPGAFDRLGLDARQGLVGP